MTGLLSEQPVGDLVAARPARARLFEQLGIDYCCGGRRPFADACRERGLDAGTVAVLLDALDDGGELIGTDWSKASVAELCDHIVDVHHAYLRRELPRLSELLAKCQRAHGDEVPTLHEMRETFELLRSELEAHLADEEDTVFASCCRLQPGLPPSAAVLGQLEAEHSETGMLLERLSALTDGYDVGGARCNTHRAALDSLAELERDLHEHIHEENNILFPRVLAMSPL